MKIFQLISNAKINRSDAEILLASAAEKNREWIFAHADDELEIEVAEIFDALVERRKLGEPVAYLVGQQEFFGLDFAVDRRVLIPRPETEILVEEVLKLQPTSLLDVGTGSGAIAIAVAKNLSGCRVAAVDISTAALAVARENSKRHAAEIKFFESDLLTEIPENDFEIVVANLPYVAENSVDLEKNVAEFEPPHALFSGADGLDEIRQLLVQISRRENLPHVILLEIGFDQATALTKFIRQIFPNSTVEIRCDLAGLDRVAKIFLK